MAGVMMAAMSITSFAATELWTVCDDDGYGTVYDDGTMEYYDLRRNTYSWVDYDGSYGEVDRRGNVSYYDADYDEYYYVSNSSRSSKSNKNNRMSGNGRVVNDLPAATPTVSTKTASKGWERSNAGWKYRRPNGTYANSGWEQIEGKWYNFDNNGSLKTNQWICSTSSDHVWYYVGSDGAMLKNTTVDNYFINANGECIC